MIKESTPDERKQKLLKNLEKARAAKRQKDEEKRLAIENGTYKEPVRKRKPKNLDKIIREILDDETLIDKVVANQPDYWSKIPVKNGGYIISTVMMVKAMGGDIKAAEWIRKTGFGDKVMLESENGFFERSEFTIQVVPSRALEGGIDSKEVLESEIQQIEEEYVS